MNLLRKYSILLVTLLLVYSTSFALERKSLNDNTDRVILEFPIGNPTFVFSTVNVTTTTTGIQVNGNNYMLLGSNDSISVTFDNVSIRYTDNAIISGAISFNAPVALLVTMVNNGAQYSFRRGGDSLGSSDNNKIMLNLPADTKLTSQGLVVNGSAVAHLKYTSYNLRPTVQFSSAVFGINPLSLISNPLSFSLNNLSIGTLGPNGFIANNANLISNFVPELLQLGSGATAPYLKIKENGNYLVTLTETNTGLRITTPAGRTAKMFLPMFASGNVIPSANVVLDIVYDLSVKDLVSGTITIPQNAAQYNLWPRIPFKTSGLEYSAENGTPQLKATGKVFLFGEEIGNTVTLPIINGYISGVASLPAINKRFKLISGSDKISVLFPDITITYSALLPAQSGFEVTGNNARFEIATGTNTAFGFTFNSMYDSTGFIVDGIIPDGGSGNETINFGSYALQFEEYRLDTLKYHYTSGWRFSVASSGKMSFSFPAITLPRSGGFILNNEGIQRPAVTLNNLNIGSIVYNGYSTQILNFRMRAGIIPCFASGPYTDTTESRMDMYISFPSSVTERIPGAFRLARLYAGDIQFKNGVFNGAIQPYIHTSTLQVPLTGNNSILLRKAGATFTTSGIEGYFEGDYQLPSQLVCNNSPIAVPGRFSVLPSGIMQGSLPCVITCPLPLGPGSYTAGQSVIYYRIGETDSLELRGNGTYSVSSLGGSPTVTNGSLNLSLTTMLPISGSSLQVTGPFKYVFPGTQGLFTLRTEQGTISSAGFLLNGSGALPIGAVTVPVTFSNLVTDLHSGKVIAGGLTFDGQFGLVYNFSETPGWSLTNDTGIPADKTVRLFIPSGTIADTGGIRFLPAATAALQYQAKQATGIPLNKDSRFRLVLTPETGFAGRAALISGTDTLGFLNETGFVAGSYFSGASMPEKLVFSSNTAYLQLRTGSTENVTITPVAEGYRVQNKSGATVPFVVPGLKYTSTTEPRFSVPLDIVVDRNWQKILSGKVIVNLTSSPFSLKSVAGLPLRITSLSVSPAQAAYQITASGKLELPQVVSLLSVPFNDMQVTNTGLTGTFAAGTYSELAVQAPKIDSIALGTVIKLTAQGVSLSLNPSTGVQEIKFSGDFSTALFRDSLRRQAALHYTAKYSAQSGRFNFGVNYDNFAGSEIPMEFATLKPMNVGSSPALAVNVYDSDVELIFSGKITIGKMLNFELIFSGLKISKNGVSAPSVTFANNEAQQLKIFNALFDISKVSFAFDPATAVLKMSFDGDVTFMKNKSSFTGLKVGTDGSISLESSNLLSAPFNVVRKFLWLTSLNVGSDSFFVSGYVKLPKPADTSRHHFTFAIDKQGNISGGARITLFNEKQSKLHKDSSLDRSEYKLWKFTFDPTYLGLNLVFPDIERSSIEMIADIYITDSTSTVPANPSTGTATATGTTGTTGTGSTVANKPTTKKAMIGDKASMSPGVIITFDGSLTVQNLTFPKKMFGTKWNVFYLDIGGFTVRKAQDEDDVEFLISGGLFLDLKGSGGSLTVRDLIVTSSGELPNLGTAIETGTLTINKVLNIEVNNIAFSTSPTSIWVKGGTAANTNGQSTADSTQIRVESFFRMGALIEVPGVASGGVEELISYTTDAGNYELVIRNANLTIGSSVSLYVDLKYLTAPGGYSILLSGRGEIVKRFVVVAVGKVSVMNDQTSFGVFVAAQNMQLMITPNMALTGLGGGFFYNASEDDKNKVLAGLKFATNEQSRVTNASATFNIMIYAKIDMVPPGGAAGGSNSNTFSGEVLLMITDQYLALYGKGWMLGQKGSIEGSFYLGVGFKNGFAEGNLNINVNMQAVITGTANLSFYVYGSDTWAIYGSFTASVAGFLNASGNLFIGPPGFLVSLSASQGFDIWIIAVSAGIEVKLWYIRDVSWGAYLKAWIDVSLGGGIVSARGQLEGAMIKTNNDFLIYGLASLVVDVIVFSFDGTVWIKIKNGDLSSGFGRDSEMDNLIRQATLTSNAISTAQSSAMAQVASNQLGALSLTSAEQQAAFRRMYAAAMQLSSPDATERQNAVSLFSSLASASIAVVPGFFTKLAVTGQINSVISNVLGSGNVSTEALKTEWINSRGAFDQKVTDFNSAATATSNKITEILSAQINSLVPANFRIAGSPVSGTNFGSSAPIRNISTGAGGIVNASATGAPDFTYNTGIGSSNIAAMRASDSAASRYEQNIRNNIAEYEARLTSLRNFLNNVSDNSYPALAGRLVTLSGDVDSYYERYFGILYQDKYYARRKMIELENIVQFRNTLKDTGMIGEYSRLDPLSQVAYAVKLNSAGPELYKSILLAAGADTAQRVIQYRDAFFNLTVAQKCSVVVANLISLWYTTPYQAFADLDQNANVSLFNSYSQYEAANTGIFNKASAITSAADTLHRINTSLTEKLFDIYNRYGYWKERQTDSVKNAPIALSLITSKKLSLMNDLRVPAITSLTAVMDDRLVFSRARLNWSVAIPSTAVEYAVSYTRSSGDVKPFFSVGNITSFNKVFVPKVTNNQVGIDVVTFRLRARGVGGYTNTRQFNAQANFSLATNNDYSALANSGGTSFGMSADATPPVVAPISMTGFRKLSATAALPMRWVGVPLESIQFTWAASDNESGIIYTSYSLYETKTSFSGASASLRNPWQYPGDYNLVVPETRVGGRTSVELLGLPLRHGYAYNLMLKVVNGSNGETYSGFTFVVDTVEGNKAFRATFSNQLTPDGRPRFAVSCSELIDDLMLPGGGIEMRVSALNSSENFVSQWTALNRTGDTYTLNFLHSKLLRKRSYLIELRPYFNSGAGTVTATQVFTTLADVTPPNSPAVQVEYAGPFRLKLRFTVKAVDNESDILGYQIGYNTNPPNPSSPTWDNVKSVGLPVDFYTEDIAAGQDTIGLWLSPGNRTDAVEYDVYIRAINGDTLAGPWTGIGTVSPRRKYDLTPPTAVSSNASFNRDTKIISFTSFTGGTDSETPTRIEIAYGTNPQNPESRSWSDPNVWTSSALLSEVIPLSYIQNQGKVYIRAVNSAGVAGPVTIVPVSTSTDGTAPEITAYAVSGARSYSVSGMQFPSRLELNGDRNTDIPVSFTVQDPQSGVRSVSVSVFVFKGVLTSNTSEISQFATQSAGRLNPSFTYDSSRAMVTVIPSGYFTFGDLLWIAVTAVNNDGFGKTTLLPILFRDETPNISVTKVLNSTTEYELSIRNISSAFTAGTDSLLIRAVVSGSNGSAQREIVLSLPANTNSLITTSLSRKFTFPTNNFSGRTQTVYLIRKRKNESTTTILLNRTVQ